MKVKVSKLKGRVEDFLLDGFSCKEFEVIEVQATELLNSNRFDIAAKVLYLEMLNSGVSFAEEIYVDHIRAFTLGKFIEPGSNNKNSIAIFLEDFISIYEDIKQNGFDSEKSIIPCDKDLVIINGAHRVASAIAANRKVSLVVVGQQPPKYDYRFFMDRSVPRPYLDAIAIKYVELSKKSHVAFLWPSAIGSDSEVENLIPNIVYKKKIKLTMNGAHNLLSQVYLNEEWLGSIECNFPGVKGKLVECFKGNGDLRIIVFDAPPDTSVLEIKESIRSIYNIGKHSIHITDNHKEAINSARLTLNDNSIHFLNFAQPSKYPLIIRQIEKIRKDMMQHGVDPNSFVFDSGVVLSAYGIREAKDIDCLFLEDENLSTSSYRNIIDSHDNELKYHKQTKQELILNSKFHFFYNGVKFISFNQLINMKKNRGERKDLIDIELMAAMVERNFIRSFCSKVKHQFLYLKVRIKVRLIQFLRAIGIYKYVKHLQSKVQL